MALRIVMTLIITLGIVALVLSVNPEVGSFFQSLVARISGSLAPEPQRGVALELAVDHYPPVEFTRGRNMNFTFAGENFTAALKEGNLNLTTALVKIEGFEGSGTIVQGTVTLDGRFERLETPAGVFLKGTAKARAGFNNLSVEGMSVGELKLSGAGFVSIGATRTELKGGDVTLTAPLGTFTFGSGVAFSGTAAKVQMGNVTAG